MDNYINNKDVNNIYDEYINDLLKSCNTKEEFKAKLKKLPIAALEYILTYENNKLVNLRKQIIEEENA